MVNPTAALLARLLGFSFGKSRAPIHHPKPPSGRLWRDLIIARPGEENAPTVAGASGRVNLRTSLCAAGAAKLLLRTKTQTTLSPNKL